MLLSGDPWSIDGMSGILGLKGYPTIAICKSFDFVDMFVSLDYSETSL